LNVFFYKELSEKDEEIDQIKQQIKEKEEKQELQKAREQLLLASKQSEKVQWHCYQLSTITLIFFFSLSASRDHSGVRTSS